MANKETLKKVENLFKKYKNVKEQEAKLKEERSRLKEKILKIVKDKKRVVVGEMECVVTKKKNIIIDIDALYDSVEPVEAFLKLVSPTIGAIKTYYKNKIPGEIITDVVDQKSSISIKHV